MSWKYFAGNSCKFIQNKIQLHKFYISIHNLCSILTPFATITTITASSCYQNHPHCLTLPPPCFTVMVLARWWAMPSFLQTFLQTCCFHQTRKCCFSWPAGAFEQVKDCECVPDSLYQNPSIHMGFQIVVLVLMISIHLGVIYHFIHHFFSLFVVNCWEYSDFGPFEPLY